MKKIGVFLPIAYRGGSLRAAKNIAKMILLGSKECGEPVQVVFSHCGEENFADLEELGIAVRETKWETISQDNLRFIGHFRTLLGSSFAEKYLLPNDGISFFSDCDAWLLISDRTLYPLAPVKPYGMIIYDYIQRYVPKLSIDDTHFLTTARNAKFVFTTTPQTHQDAIQYGGIDPQKVFHIPMDFSPPQIPPLNAVERKDYFMWVTNASPHKNHERALKALQQYYQEGGTLDVAIIGVNSHLFADCNSPNLYAKNIACTIKNSAVLSRRCRIVGEIADEDFSRILLGARFNWHPALFDNGTFSVIEAAYLGVPSLSSDYASMRYINDRFQLNLLFSDPYDSMDMGRKLKLMERLPRLVPDRSFLKQFTFEKEAASFWKCLQKGLSLP